jgi:hypothetical protein
LVSKRTSHFEIFDKSDIPNFSFHFLYNKKGLKIIACHVQGIIRHCMNNIKFFLKKHGRMNQLEK